MPSTTQDPTDPIRRKAGRYAGVDEGKACTQTSFKSGKKAFLYVGMAKGRHKAMFCLRQSIPEATNLARMDPDRFEVGSMGWVTARFTADDPMPRALWQRWLEESYQLSQAAGGTTTSRKPIRKASAQARAKK